jgi:hypothetical protein
VILAVFATVFFDLHRLFRHHLHIRIDLATHSHEDPATRSHIKVAGPSHFKVATYSHLNLATPSSTVAAAGNRCTCVVAIPSLG